MIKNLFRKKKLKYFKLDKYDIGKAELDFWKTIDVKSGKKRLIVRVRIEKPTIPDIAQYSKCISIIWDYQPNEANLPCIEDRNQHEEFERALDDLTMYNNLSFLMGVSNGMGMKEWAFYSKDTDEFMVLFNERTSNLPKLPIKIHFYDDPEWEIWKEKLKFHEKGNEKS
jgi:hypothetical protein